MSDLELGEHVGVACTHWGLHHHHKLFRLAGRERSDDRSLQGAVQWIFNGPALELELRIAGKSSIIYCSLKGQVFDVVRSK